MYIYVYTCICMYIHVYICICMYMLLLKEATFVESVYEIYRYIHVCICIYMYMYMYEYVYTCIYMYIYVYKCICFCCKKRLVFNQHTEHICIYMYIYVYTCICFIERSDLCVDSVYGVYMYTHHVYTCIYTYTLLSKEPTSRC